MKALISTAPGGPETLTLVERPTPEPGPGQLRVKVLACGVNYPDALIIKDRYQIRPERPFSPGAEIVGVVEALGEDVRGWATGDRLMAVITYGGLAEQVVLDAARAVFLPPDRDAIEGAAFLLTYATALHALSDRGRLGAGEVVLVLGAAGGVGLAAIEVAKAMGATVIAAVSNDAKAIVAREAGADRTVIYDAGPLDEADAKALARSFKAAVGPGGADVVCDIVGGGYCEPALRSLGWGGRYLVIGFTAGIPRPPLNLALLKSCDISGVFWGAFAEREPERNRANVERLMTWWREGRVRPRVSRVFDLAQGGEAIAWLAGRHAVGKAVVRVCA